MYIIGADRKTRNRVIASHLARLESSLARTQETVASLRGLLDRPQDGCVPIDHRHVRRCHHGHC
jgi:hypothetical protein